MNQTGTAEQTDVTNVTGSEEVTVCNYSHLPESCVSMTGVPLTNKESKAAVSCRARSESAAVVTRRLLVVWLK